MNIQKLIDFITDHFSNYFYIMGKTLAGSPPLFEPVKNKRVTDSILVGDNFNNYQDSNKLNPQLFVYSAISVFLGVVFNTLKEKSNGLGFEFDFIIISFIFLMLSWLLYSSIVFLFCKALRGKGTYAVTISALIQLLSTVYVISSFLGLGFIAIYSFFVKKPIDPFSLMDDQTFVYYVIHILLLMVYIPITLKPIHKFGIFRSFALGVIPPIFAFFGVILVIFIGGGFFRGS